MRCVAAIPAGPMRHYFFEIAPGNTIAFFEWKGASTFAKPAGMPSSRTLQFDHLSFNLPDEEALHALQRRLRAHGCEVTEVIDHTIVRSIYFTDPHGIALEASWWVIDPTGRPADYSDTRLFSDADPVPAAVELRDQGAVQSIPATRLVDEPTGDIYRPS
jgi:catechol 2,3-dioxygenase-like lactoylglutathione lyase family enzyme